MWALGPKYHGSEAVPGFKKLVASASHLSGLSLWEPGQCEERKQPQGEATRAVLADTLSRGSSGQPALTAPLGVSR